MWPFKKKTVRQLQWGENVIESWGDMELIVELKQNEDGTRSMSIFERTKKPQAS